ncbi:NlpC/P60 family protein [Ilyomonas limi]|uniref:NlpC/P60 family protein n=1 Tax=Ilyomonas limi TaxID=2575867 RepID=A0A4U3L9I4_9BACT|nr:C40 family peptidase [Ilyomonas limi]TKK71742.1 NlpC/P60 family protein [Ilyomonas limi]
MKFYFMAGCLLFTTACSNIQEQNDTNDSATKTTLAAPLYDSIHDGLIQTNSVTPQQIVDYAETLIGIPYKYASANPQQGFDCSGFITYVFNHFNIEVPRSSVEFTNAYPEVPVDSAKEGDLILFTGTDSTEKAVGHMGIIVSNSNGSIVFIHSTSGKANGVTITPLNDYYKSRFVKIVSIFK